MPNSVLEDLQARLSATRREVEDEFEAQLAAQRERFRYTLQRGRVRFEREVRDLHRRYRKGLLKYIIGARLGFILSAPLIYGLIVPLVFLDLAVTLYQQVCFRIYGIPLVRRGDHIVIDRQHLAYLNGIEKLNCIYCGYANGMIAYVREIAGRTEQFWCPIKHARRTVAPHDHVETFFDYGDAEAYHSGLKDVRKQWKD